MSDHKQVRPEFNAPPYIQNNNIYCNYEKGRNPSKTELSELALRNQYYRKIR